MKTTTHIATLTLTLLASLAPRAGAVDKYWTPSGSSWNTAGNWFPNGVPGSGDVAIFDGNTNSADCGIDTNVNVAGILITNGYSGTITQQSTRTITVGSSGWRQHSGTFAGGTDTVSFGSFRSTFDYTSCDFTLAGGTFTCTSGRTLQYDGNFTHTAGGTFNHNNGTYEFVDMGNGVRTIDVAASETFHNLAMRANGSGSYGSYDLGTGDTVVVLGVYSNNGVCCGYGTKGGTIETRGNVVVGNYSSARGLGTATNLFLVGGDQTISGAGGSFMNVTVSKSSGTLSAVGNLNVANFTLTSGTFLSTTNTLQVKGNFTHTAGGTFSHNNGTVEFLSVNSPTFDVAGTGTLYNLSMLAPGNGDYGVAFIGTGDTLIVEGVFSNNGCCHRQGAIEARGNVSIGGYDQSGTRGDATTALRFSGAGAQTCAYLGGTKLSGATTIDKSGGSVTLATDFPLTAGGQPLVWTNGALDLSSNTLTVAGAVTIHPGATTLGVAVADTNKAGRLTCSNTVSGIANAGLVVTVTAPKGQSPQIQEQTYTILSNTNVLAAPFESVTWVGNWRGTVDYTANGGKNATLSSVRAIFGGTILLVE